MIGTLLSVLMLAGLGLLAGGVHLLVRRRDRKRAILMIVAAVVMFGNVAIWLAPTENGRRLGTSAAPS